MQKIRTGVLSAIGMLLLILDSKTGIQGAADGLMLCIQSVIPSLFPFFLLSILLTGALTGMRIPALTPVCRLCRIPRGSGSILLVGMLGGYPVGAQAIAQAFRAGSLSKTDAQRMLGFCSNAGPSFLFGIIACKFSKPGYAWILWVIHIVSAVITSILLPGGSRHCVQMKSGVSLSLPEALRKAVNIMASVCGWVILFRVIIAFLSRWLFWLLPQSVQIILNGILELTNGCCTLDSISNESLRFVICSGILAFGGICVAMQTVSVTGELGIGSYFPGKLLQTAVSIFLAMICQYVLFPIADTMAPNMLLAVICLFVIVLTPLFLRKKQKNSSIPALNGV